MEGQPFFTTIAGLSVSLAGFGAVIAWLRDDPTTWDPVNLWRVKTIVRHALTIAFICLALVPIFTFTGDAPTTIRVGSGLVVSFLLSDLWRFRYPDWSIWTPPVSWSVYMSTGGLIALAATVNIAWASLGLFQVLILVLLTSPAAIFSNFVRELSVRRPRSLETEPGE